MKKQSILKAIIEFDGQMAVDRDFDLHLRFDHSVEKRNLLVKNVARGNNPLTVIDAFV
jgi:hypothetical protein